MTGFKKDFEMKEVLGKGQYGQVFRAVRLKDDEEFAVKVLCKQDINTKGDGPVALNEVKILR